MNVQPRLEIGPAHSGLQLSAYPGEEAVISGGVPLSLRFDVATAKSGKPALVATLPASLPAEHIFTELFVEDGIWAN